MTTQQPSDVVYYATGARRRLIVAAALVVLAGLAPGGPDGARAQEAATPAVSGAAAEDTAASPMLGVPSDVAAPAEGVAAPARPDPATATPAAAAAAPTVPQPTESGASAPAVAGAQPMVDRALLPRDLSPRAMFLTADAVVKGVIIGLIVASLLTWTVWLAKSIELMAAKMRLRRAIRAIIRAGSLREAGSALGAGRGVAAALVRAAEHEVERSADALDHAGGAGLIQRVASHLSRIEARAGRRMALGTGLLATVGSTAPFVGLFGTVWGIMNAFIGISHAQTTNLAVVAPGIAEALLATAVGLVAAIPAVVIYNVFARSIGGYRQLLGDAAAGIERLVSRDLDYRKVPPAEGAEAAGSPPFRDRAPVMPGQRLRLASE